MLRLLVPSLLAAAGACGPTPAHMPATRASEVLERFAAGIGGDVCTPSGRAELRGAVRAYGNAMNANGIAWLATEGDLNGVEATVLAAFGAGFLEVSDFRGPARAAVDRLAFASWPEFRGMRTAARVACGEVVAWQHSAARVLVESERLRQMDEGRPDHLQRQRERVARAHTQMQQHAALVSARVGAPRES